MSTNSKTIRLYLYHAWQYKIYVVCLLLLLPIVVITGQVFPPIIAANILDKLAAKEFVNGDFWGSFGSQIILYSFCITISGTIMWRIINYLIWTLEIKVIKEMTERMFNHLSSLDMEFHNNSFGGSLVSRTNKLTSSYIRLADTVIFDLYGLIVMSIATGVVLWPKAPQFVGAFYIIATVFILIAFRITRYIRKLASIEATKQNKVTGYIADMVTNVMAVKSFARNDYEAEKFSEVTQSVATASTKLKWSQLHRENVFSLSNSTLTTTALLLAVLAVVNFGAEVGTVFLVLNFSMNMTVRLWEFAQRTLRNFNKAMGDAQEGVEILYREPEIRDIEHPLDLPQNAGSIEFKNVNFSHDNSGLFNNFNLKIKNGEKIGLVGRSGSGKTTLTKLILRFKDINEGNILINGIDIRKVLQKDLRQTIAYVPQEPLLFHRTLKENIRYGKLEASDEEIFQAAEYAHATEFISKLDNNYETMVGERGVKLSGGQKQRIAIARAMIKDAPILLLDEATSALDSESEQLIQDALWKLMDGKTAIVIAHRLSTIQKMDRIIVLENGKIIEDGSHDKLLSRKGPYSKLWQHQSGGFLQD